MVKSSSYRYRVKYSYKAQQPWAYEALERDEYICQGCKSSKLNLVVHHIDESRRLGAKNMNNNLDNLITLCKQCHAERHGYTIKIYNSQHMPLIEELKAQGMTYGQIGKYIGISRQRVHQLLKKFDKIAY